MGFHLKFHCSLEWKFPDQPLLCKRYCGVLSVVTLLLANASLTLVMNCLIFRSTYDFPDLTGGICVCQWSSSSGLIRMKFS